MALRARITMERELKLGVPRGFRLPDLPGEPLPPCLLTSTYYDTSDHRLARAGITLRRRVEARKGAWQVKIPHGPARLELELPGGADGPPGAVGDLLFAHLRGAAVLPMAVLRTRRAGVRVTDADGPVADVVVDTVGVRDGGRAARWFRELEVELRRDDEDALHRIETVLREAGAGDHDGRPKLFRALGWELPKPEPPLPPSAPAVEHLRVMLLAQVRAILSYDPGTRLGLDPEELHQMRVATRRLRAILRAARPMLVRGGVEPLRQELAWLGGLLGPVRDRDVLLQRFREEAESLEPDERRTFERLLKGLVAERTASRAAMLEGLRSERYLELLDRVDGAAREPQVVTPDVSLRDLAAAEFKRLRKAVKALPPQPGNADLHRVRIRCKRARYAAELAEAVIGRPASRFIRRAKVLQDLLGEHQDAVVAEGKLRELLSRSRGASAAFAAGRIIERERARRSAARSGFKKTWARLEKRGRTAWG